MGSPVNVKASLKIEEHHVLEIKPTTLSLQQFKDDIKKTFPLLNQENIDLNLYWKDSDGDRISLSTDADLRHAVKHVNGKLQIDIEVLYVTPHQGRQYQNTPYQGQHHNTVSAALESQYDVRNPPVSSRQPPYHSHAASPQISNRPKESVAYQPAVEYESRSTGSSNYDSMMDSNVFHESVGRQTSSRTEPEPECDQLDIPDNTPLFEGWPTSENYALNMISKQLKRNLDENFLSDRTYDTDPGRQCRVLCILNKESGGKPIYPGSNMDTECTFLQQLSKRLKWRLQIHKNKTSAEILKIVDDEIGEGFDLVHSLLVIIMTRGDRYGIYGTQGELIEYLTITTKFDKAPTLKDKPKIFIFDDCEIGSDIRDEVGVHQTEMSKTPITTPKESNGSMGTGDQRDCVAYTEECQDTYICKASTLGRSDKVVKGSWIVGALISVICKAGSRMTFQKMMTQVDFMLQDSVVPAGKPEPQMTITNKLTKDLYLLPPPS